MEGKNTKKNKVRGKTPLNEAPLSGPRTQKVSLVKCPNCRTENLSDSRFCSNCASLLRESESSSRTVKSAAFEISRGDLFAGRYEIIETLGQGGMGKVYKAYDRKLNEVVALKLIRPEISVNDKAIERFKNELKIARRITHRNICRTHDLGEEGFFHYITMEYVAGEDLKRFIRRAGTLSSGKAINIAKQVGEGLAEAHRLGVIHRDLKPQNIMIDQDGNAKIMDFGIARFVDTDRMTGSGVMIGTPEYMSPEQAELKDVDKRADIYSLGVVLYEMVSGQVPFDGETPLSIAMKHKTEKPMNVRELNAHIAAGLAEIVSKCMEKAPGDRYQSAEELIENLNCVERDLSTAERVIAKKEPAVSKEIAAKFQAKKLLIPAAAVILLGFSLYAVLRLLPKKVNLSAPAQSANVSGQEGASSTIGGGGGQARDIESKSIPKPLRAEEKNRGAALNPSTAKKGSSKAKDAAENDSSEAEKASANLAAARVTAARSLVQKNNIDTKTFFLRLAEAEAEEGRKSLSKNNPREARSAFVVSEKLFRVCLKKNKDEDRLKAFIKYAENLRKNIEDERKSSERDPSLESAREIEKQGAEFRSKKDLENAAKSYVQASVVYEKILQSLKMRIQ